ncbi:MAG: phosphocholine cytidylyltransferase family protein [Pyrinomonadaceae bacterium]|nr:phosphocholine cytidylyltransferase family protein [Pyrinomonadaceae bacterium]
MKAVLLAAGSSTRLYPLTKNTPKCLLDVGGKTLLEHQLDALADCGVSGMIIVTGYLSQMLEEKLEQIGARYPFKFSFVHNRLYAETNNIYSLWTAREALKDAAFLCLHADVLFHPQILRRGALSSDDVCLIADEEVLEETMKLKVKDNRVIAVGKHVSMEEASGTFLGLVKFSEDGGRRMLAEVERLITENRTKGYFTDAIERMIAGGYRVGVSFTQGLPWIEIDVKEELEQARREVYARIMEAQAV